MCVCVDLHLSRELLNHTLSQPTHISESFRKSQHLHYELHRQNRNEFSSLGTKVDYDKGS